MRHHQRSFLIRLDRAIQGIGEEHAVRFGVADEEFESIFPWRPSENQPGTVQGEERKSVRADPVLAKLRLGFPLKILQRVGKAIQSAFLSHNENSYSILFRNLRSRIEPLTDHRHNGRPIRSICHRVVHQENPENAVIFSKFESFETRLICDSNDPNGIPD